MNKPATLLLLMTCIASSHAESIGHAEVTMSEPWVALTTYQTKLRYDNGLLEIPVSNKVYYMPGASGMPKALLVLSGTDARIPGNVRWVSEHCPEPRTRFFAQDFDSNRQTRVRECMVVNPSFAPAAYFAPDSEVVKAAAARGLKLFKVGYSFRSAYGTSGGALVQANFVASTAFRGSPTEPAATQLHDVAPELVAWGEALHAAVRISAASASGEFVLPPLAFAP